MLFFVLLSESVSPYIFQKQRKSNSESYKDDTVEKGETDSLRKENVMSGSEDEEKYNNEPPKEKRFKQDYHVNSFPNQRSIYTTTTEDKEKGMKIVTSVSVNEKEDSSPKIMFQQSHEPLSENPTHSSTEVTNIMKINCAGSHVKLEIQEIVQHNTFGIKTTVVFMNETGDGAERLLRCKCDRMGFPNNGSSEQPQDVTNYDASQNTTNYRFTFGGMSEQTLAHNDSTSVSPTKIWGNPNYCQCCSHRNQQMSTDFTFADHPSSPPPLLNIKPQEKRKHFCKSFNSVEFWDIPPPQDFADIKYNTLEDLTHDLASCRIGAGSPADKQQWEFHPTPNITCSEESGCPFSAVEKEKADLLPLFDQLSESDNYEPMFMRPSLSTNRSSFTKDFVNCQKRKSWIRNNSIATVEHRACFIPKKRRQTFPGMSEGPGLFQEGLLGSRYNESFASDTISSLMMCLLPLQTERPGRINQCDDRFSAFGIGNYNSSQTKGSSKLVSEIPNSHDGKQSSLRPFYTTSYEDPDDAFIVNEQCRRQSGIRYHCKDLRQQDSNTDSEHSVCKFMENLDTGYCGDKLDQSEVADSGFDQEMGEVEYHSPEPFTDERSRRAFSIQITPPSCSGSEEQILQCHPVILFQNNKVENASQEDSVSLKHSALEQRFVMMDSRLTLGSCMEKHLQSTLEGPHMPTLQGTDVHLLNTNEVTEDIQPKPSGEKTGNTSPSLSLMIEETNDLQLETGRMGKEDSDQPVVTTSCPSKGSTDTEIHTKDQLSKSDKTDKQTISRCKLQ